MPEKFAAFSEMVANPKNSESFSGLGGETALKRENLWFSRELAARTERR